MQLPTEKEQKDKQRSTKHYTENKRSSNTSSLQTGGEVRCSGMVNSSCSTCGTCCVSLDTNEINNAMLGNYVYLIDPIELEIRNTTESARFDS